MKRSGWLVTLCLAWIMHSPLFAQDKASADAAQKADMTWLNLVDNAHYAQSWQTASAVFRAAVSESIWSQQVQTARQPLGKVISRTLQNTTLRNAPPNAPAGTYIVSTYKSAFEHKPVSLETIVAIQEKDGSWRIVGYQIN